MHKPSLKLICSGPLHYLISIPGGEPAGKHPLVCFLHGNDEGAPAPIEKALLKHGPLSPGNERFAREHFVIVAPQMPEKGDAWYSYALHVRSVARTLEERHGTDPDRRYLTGFSYGGNGVLDLALVQPGFWAALWPVDPTRVPESNPEGPRWFSSGESSRRGAKFFIERLQLMPLDKNPPGESVYEDRGQNHEGTARLAYREQRIYRWLLEHRLRGVASP